MSVDAQPGTNRPGQPRPLSLAISPCPNDTFSFHALLHGQVTDAPAVTVTYADIDVLNGRAERRRDDLVKVSYAALPWLLADYQLLTSGGALGRGCGPLVLTAGRTDLRGARVAIPGTRTTAYLLFRLWAAGVGLAAIDVLPFEQIMPAVRAGRYDAGLVIHESRFTYPSYGLTAVADLGDWWEGQTSLPIPLGAILARRELDGPALSEVVRDSVARAFADPSASHEYVLAHAQEMESDVVEAHIKLYVNEFSLDLGDEGFAAVEALLARAAAADLVPHLTQPLR
ncbi:1,4-dihydroxy-6-naphthoate synthase [Frankia sp. AgPm24]|uniref:1,4-dihydroxy-6-naphthoate synthase n=1 Tax=Frankia sp. AgPm24 TaxID=631128 RepID=UPI00200BB16E|nr:1,4-dihydroxy-6-naphthoate synthase [Frankia sp. AgPm24]MCK9920746.1 1,4-dihydroxy-6-naphthoate synthase [Frankia sp. AgPm24]